MELRGHLEVALEVVVIGLQVSQQRGRPPRGECSRRSRTREGSLACRCRRVPPCHAEGYSSYRRADRWPWAGPGVVEIVDVAPVGWVWLVGGYAVDVCTDGRVATGAGGVGDEDVESGLAYVET